MSSAPNRPAAAPASTEYIERLRNRHQVRPLNPNEEGFSIARLPVGVYGYAYAPGQPEAPLFAKRTYHSFEVHKAADGSEHILGFVTAQESGDIEARKEGAQIRMLPDPMEDSIVLVSIRFDQIIPPKRMPRESGNPFPFTLA